MTPDVEAQYQEIATIVTENLADEWAQAWVYIEMLEDTGVASAYLERPTGTLHFIDDADLDLALYRAFRKLRLSWSSSSGDLWSVATFTVRANGKFSIDVEYQDVSDAGQTFDRRQDWERRQFGKRQIGTVSRGQG